MWTSLHAILIKANAHDDENGGIFLHDDDPVLSSKHHQKGGKLKVVFNYSPGERLGFSSLSFQSSTSSARTFPVNLISISLKIPPHRNRTNTLSHTTLPFIYKFSFIRSAIERKKNLQTHSNLFHIHVSFTKKRLGKFRMERFLPNANGDA